MLKNQEKLILQFSNQLNSACNSAIWAAFPNSLSFSHWSWGSLIPVLQNIFYSLTVFKSWFIFIGNLYFNLPLNAASFHLVVIFGLASSDLQIIHSSFSIASYRVDWNPISCPPPPDCQENCSNSQEKFPRLLLINRTTGQLTNPLKISEIKTNHWYDFKLLKLPRAPDYLLDSGNLNYPAHIRGINFMLNEPFCQVQPFIWRPSING